MDEELTLHELNRLEAERKLRAIPQVILETAWVREAQIEAVIDAVLAVAIGGDAAALVRARHVGEWSARVAAALPHGPEPSFVRRVAVLSDADPDALDRIPELQHLGPCVRDFQAFVVERAQEAHIVSLIVAVAGEFNERVMDFAQDRGPSPSLVLREMLAAATDATRPIIEALAASVQFSAVARVA